MVSEKRRRERKQFNNLFIYVFPAIELRIAKLIEARRQQKWLQGIDVGVAWDDMMTRRVLWQLEVLIYVGDDEADATWINRNSMRNF